MFPQNHQVLMCLAMPTKVFVAVQLKDVVTLHIFNTLVPSDHCQQILTGLKLYKIGE